MLGKFSVGFPMTCIGISHKQYEYGKYERRFLEFGSLTTGEMIDLCTILINKLGNNLITIQIIVLEKYLEIISYFCIFFYVSKQSRRAKTSFPNGRNFSKHRTTSIAALNKGFSQLTSKFPSNFMKNVTHLYKFRT